GKGRAGPCPPARVYSKGRAGPCPPARVYSKGRAGPCPPARVYSKGRAGPCPPARAPSVLLLEAVTLDIVGAGLAPARGTSAMAIKKSELYSSLWKSCDELRGGMDASQYKDYILVLLFVKYVSDKYAGQPDQIIEVPKGG